MVDREGSFVTVDPVHPEVQEDALEEWQEDALEEWKRHFLSQYPTVFRYVIPTPKGENMQTRRQLLKTAAFLLGLTLVPLGLGSLRPRVVSEDAVARVLRMLAFEPLDEKTLNAIAGILKIRRDRVSVSWEDDPVKLKIDLGDGRIAICEPAISVVC